ncbi:MULTISPECIES: hypothetical protein [Acinetobacter]|uniref:hypothetical protein n=1 Tax=Acinetobacter TaxID=469 RepID=UPI000CEC07B7|nr:MULTISPECIES: hypothetical protein [Acinetobacter]MDM1487147.1 hypothetical protein [Acinetobacter towneri]
MKKTLLCLTLAGLLSACGGSDNDSSDDHPSPNPPATTTQTGVLTDGPVSGVKYIRSSSTDSIEGMTNDDGEFQYIEGEEIRFFIGDVQLGEVVEAKERITPLDLAETPEARTNLMVFLQSLDDHGDHSDGIQITEDTRTAFTAVNLDFNQSFTDFSNEIVSKMGIPQDQLITPEEAASNFQATFYKDIAGSWELDRGETNAIVLHILPDGRYAIGEAYPSDETGFTGIEFGSLNWDSVTTGLNPSIMRDTNGDYGLSHPDENGQYRLNYNGKDLVVTETRSDGVANFTRIEQSTGLVGTWALNETHLFAFFESGHYFLLDLQGDNDCATPGIEYGKYSTTANTLAVTANLFDTNGCGGLHDSTNGNMINATYSISGTSLTLHPQGEDPVTFQRSK